MPGRTPLRRWLESHLAAAVAIARARPDFLTGVRAAVACVLPLWFGELHDTPQLVWMALGGWLGTLADSGGAYRDRAWTFAAFALAAGLLVAAGALLGGNLWLAVALLAAGAIPAGAVRALGEAATNVSTLALIALCVSLGTPAPSLDAALARAGLLVAGSGLAALLSLGLWPVHAYGPVREAVGACFAALEELARRMAGLCEQGAPEAEWLGFVRDERPRARQALERARGVLASVRRDRENASARAEQLVLLFELADLSTGGLAALTEALQGRGAAAVAELRELESAWGRLARSVANGAAPEPGVAERASAALGAIAAASDEASTLLRELREQARLALEQAARLSRNQPAQPQPQPQPEPQRQSQPQPQLPRGVLSTLLGALRPGSLHLRHGLRVAVTTCAALVFGHLAGLQKTHWITVTAVIILQPSSGATVRRALQRVTGTVLGATAAALLAPHLHGPAGVAAVLFPLSVLAVAVRPLNYGLFAILVTPVFILMAESLAGDYGLVRVRITSTLVGGAFALLGAFLLWPVREHEQLPHTLAELLEALRGYLHEVLQGAPRVAVLEARRRVGLAAANTDASLQRFLAEPHPEALAEPAMALVAWARRLNGSITALWSSPPSTPEDRARAAALEEALAALAADAREGRPHTAPGPLAPQPSEGAPPLERIARQLGVLRGALARLGGAPG